MEELHKAAAAYYKNSSSQLRQLATDFFNSMDMNGDGRVSINEFVVFSRQNGYNWIDRNLFHSLDHNGDGYLDFPEVLTLCYIMKTRGVWCRNCRTCLIGLYFTCVQCFDTAYNSYDLCTACYKAQQFLHNHASFLDSYVMLRSKRGLPPGTANLNLAMVPQPNAPNPRRRAIVPQPNPPNPRRRAIVPQPIAPNPRRRAIVPQPNAPNAHQRAIVPQPNAPNPHRRRIWLDAFRALEVALRTASILANCSIM